MFLWGTDEEKAYLKRLEAAFNSLIKRLEDFQHDWDGWDPVWRLYFRDRKKRWNRIIASYYNGDYFVSCLHGGFLSQYWQLSQRAAIPGMPVIMAHMSPSGYLRSVVDM